MSIPACIDRLGGSVSFFEYTRLPLDIVTEIIYTYNKYNQATYNPEPFYKYYLEQYEAYYAHHISFYLGFESGQFPVNNCENGLLILDLCKKYFFNDTGGKGLVIKEQAQKSIKCLRFDDAATELIEVLYLLPFSNKLASNLFEKYNIPESSAVAKSFHTLLIQHHEEYIKHLKISFMAFVISKAIVAFRRSFLSLALFDFDSVRNVIEPFCRDGDIKNTNEIINNYKELSHWVYSDNSNEEVYLLKIPRFSIYFNSQHNSYFVAIENEDYQFDDIQALKAFILSQLSNQVLTYLGIDYSLYITELMELVVDLSTSE